MLRHENKKRCLSCAEKLALVHLDLINWLIWISERFDGVHISWGFRNKADQDEMYMKGKTKAVFPLSPHNHINKKGKPEARAIDLFRLDDEGKAHFEEEWYREIAEESKKQAVPVKWGGEFKSFPDFPHFELVKGDE